MNVEELQRRVAALEAKPKSFVDRAGPWVGLFGGILGGLAALADLPSKIWPQPTTTIEPGWPVVIRPAGVPTSTVSGKDTKVAPAKGQLANNRPQTARDYLIEFNVLFRNDGSGLDTLRLDRARIMTAREHGEVFLPVTGANFLESGEAVVMPLAVDPKKTRALRCVLTVPLGPEEETRLSEPGLKTIVLDFRSAHRVVSVRLCTWMSGADAQRLFVQGQAIRYTDPHPECPGS